MSEEIQESNKIQKKVTEPEAFQMYLEMGYDRSQRKLYDLLLQNFGDNVVSLRTIEEWSVKYNWVEKADELDKKIHDETMALALKKAMRSKADILTLCQALFGRFATRLKGDEITITKRKRDGTIEERKILDAYRPNMSDIEKAYRIIKEEIGEGLPDWTGKKEINLTQVFQQIINNSKEENGDFERTNVDEGEVK